MASLKIFVLFGVVFGPIVIKGEHCPRTSKEANKYCASECVPALPQTCSSRDRDKKCICDGDCGFSCIKKDLKCPKPRTLTNGRRVVEGRKFNETATFTCHAGYTLIGASVRTCRGKGVWDGLEPICGKNCSDPDINNNNNSSIRRESNNSSGYMTGDVVHYYCAAGYVIQGNDIATCQADGTWDNNPPQCFRISCPPPTLPANSQVNWPDSFNTSQGARDGQQLLLGCKPGYYRAGFFQMTCAAGHWKLATSFECLPKSCGDPGTPSHGGKIGLTYHFRSRVQFYCDKCYKLIGAAYRDCNADQTWSGQQPRCQRVDKKCSKSLSIPNGWDTLLSNECDGKAEFQCDKHYNLVGHRVLTCRDNGTWSAKEPKCEPITCPKLITSETVRVNTSANRYGVAALFSCKDHFTLSGTNVILCQENGEWSADVPECLAPCHVKLTDNLISKSEIYKHGSKAELRCKEGHQLSGSINGNIPTCNNGTWKASIFPYCVKDKDVEKSKENFNIEWMKEALKLIELSKNKKS